MEADVEEQIEECMQRGQMKEEMVDEACQPDELSLAKRARAALSINGDCY